MHKFSSTKQDLTNCIFVYQIFERSKFDQIHFIQQYMNYSLVDCSIYHNINFHTLQYYYITTIECSYDQYIYLNDVMHVITQHKTTSV